MGMDEKVLEEINRLNREIAELQHENNRLCRYMLLEACPWAQAGVEIGRLVAEKQAAYGDSFGKSGEVLRLMYPDGITPEQCDNMLTVTRIIDKLFRIATDADALGEDPFRDIAGYALLAVVRNEQRRKDDEALSEYAEGIMRQREEARHDGQEEKEA